MIETILPDHFQFSQGSLQDFVDCRRRFELRYIRRLAWPALESEPAIENEVFLAKGALFHRLAHQHWLGVPGERLALLAQDEDLERWWENFGQFATELPAMTIYPETSLSAPIGDYRLVAKYDLVGVQPDGRALIYDWKTSRRRPRGDWLKDRLQSRVYPYLLVCAGQHLNGGTPFEPEQVQMVYWFANYPNEPDHISYNKTQYQTDENYLQELVATITTLDEGEFPLTSDERRCAYCVYRSLCDRGVKAGDWDAFEADLEAGEGLDLALDFEQIAEIEF